MDIIQSLLTCFDDYIDKLSVPAVDAQKALLALFKDDQAERLFDIMSGDFEQKRQLVDSLMQSYLEDPELFEGRVKLNCEELRSEYLQTSRRKLSSLTEFVFIDTVERSQAEKMNLIADRSNQLLELSVAHEFISRLPNGLNRASQLSEWSVKEPTSEIANQYLAEACNCFLFGFDTACVVMCRSLLEEVLERKLPDSLLCENMPKNSIKKTSWTLGRLIGIINNNLEVSLLSEDLPVLLRKVNDMGSRGAHETSIAPREALECLKTTRKAILLLL